MTTKTENQRSSCLLLLLAACALSSCSGRSDVDASGLTAAERAKLNERIAPQVEALRKEKQAQQAKELADRATRGVTIGMTEVEVLQSSWGAPASSSSTITAAGSRQVWSYPGGNALVFVDGKLSAIHTVN